MIISALFCHFVVVRCSSVRVCVCLYEASPTLIAHRTRRSPSGYNYLHSPNAIHSPNQTHTHTIFKWANESPGSGQHFLNFYWTHFSNHSICVYIYLVFIDCCGYQVWLMQWGNRNSSANFSRAKHTFQVCTFCTHFAMNLKLIKWAHMPVIAVRPCGINK